jgi:leucine dehydrogenase
MREDPLSDQDHELVIDVVGARSGLPITVAVHSTTLGPGLGGCRLWAYRNRSAARLDALRLSGAMTLKNAVAGLDAGGAKGVIAAPDGPLEGERRRAVFLDFGDLVADLGGRYITGEDVGTTAEDMRVVRERTPHVLGLPEDVGGTGEPSGPTAAGVHAAIRATSGKLFGTPDLAGRRVTVIGLGQVGSRIARRLAAEGAELTVTDIDPARRMFADEIGARWAEPGEAAGLEADLLVPVGLGGLLTDETIDALRVRAVVGPANNPLAARSGADRLHRRHILYAPDFLVNAGGVIFAGLVARGVSRPDAAARVESIGPRLSRVYAAAEAAGTTPLAAAEELAYRRLRQLPVSGAGTSSS